MAKKSTKKNGKTLAAWIIFWTNFTYNWSWFDTVTGIGLGWFAGYFHGMTDAYNFELSDHVLFMKSFYMPLMKMFGLLFFFSRSWAITRIKRPNRESVNWTEMDWKAILVMKASDHYLAIACLIFTAAFIVSLVPDVLEHLK
ncbi:MAG TPA: hypothetical protein ENI23_14070 [bacterium]|nr:hypothetical protein [bacterium]